ncbi:MAG: hypothetical protein KBO59_13675, partial [Achromobacter sp.]|nr:hypothetical protein [Achromobacter sp.]
EPGKWSMCQDGASIACCSSMSSSLAILYSLINTRRHAVGMARHPGMASASDSVSQVQRLNVKRPGKRGYGPRHPKWMSEMTDTRAARAVCA